MNRVRPGLPADAHNLTEIANRAKRHWGYPQSWIELWRQELTVTPQYIVKNPVYVVERDSQIVGFVGMSVNGVDAEIDHLWVLPEYMGLGIGRSLVGYAVQHCKSHGVERLRVASDPHAAEFYRKLGGVHEGRVESIPAPRTLPILRFDIGDRSHFLAEENGK